MFISTKYRSDEPEIMDDFAMEGEILRDALDKIAKINKLLGGNQLTLKGVQNLISKINTSTEIIIVDVGCGNGDMLRILADYGLKNQLNFKLIGIDANNFTVDYARNLSKNYSNISFQCEDVFNKAFKELKYDIVLCTLTLHHFKKEDVILLMKVFKDNSKVGIVINDLHRSIISYRLFQVVCFVFRLNSMPKKDGLTSILRGFKREELVHFSNKLNLDNYKIQWKWAFRYQWVISKI
ncbi:MAG TPA: methyltransferase domain-containing protein [Flavobacterium sp.]